MGAKGVQDAIGFTAPDIFQLPIRAVGTKIGAFRAFFVLFFRVIDHPLYSITRKRVKHYKPNRYIELVIEDFHFSWKKCLTKKDFIDGEFCNLKNRKTFRG